jgi:N-acylneuraminate cytidylyltransferase
MGNNHKKISCVALIPARAGSKRVPKKNIKPLFGHPLIAYTIRSAIDSGVFSKVIVTTENEEIAQIARQYGAETPFLRPAKFAADSSSDIDWVLHALSEFKKKGELFDCFSILRPTNPLRQPETIRRAWQHFLKHKKADSLRAVEKCTQHPAKMWFLNKEISRMKPVIIRPGKNKTPWHSMAYQMLPPIYAQNASLEIAWTRVPLKKGTIAGNNIVPFISEGYEGFDINYPEDWIVLEYLIKNKLTKLPKVKFNNSK